MKKIYKYLILIIMITSCEEKINWETNSGQITRLVVDGIITNERIRQQVSLFLPVKNLNETPYPVSGALVVITDQEDFYLLSEEPGIPGTYLTEDTVQGVLGKVYTLYIRIREYEFFANSYMVPVGLLQKPNILPCDLNDQYFHLLPESAGDPFMMHIYIDWKNTSYCSDDMSCHARINHYHLNSIDVNEFFKPEKETVCFPLGTRIIRRKFSLNPEHQQFVRSMLMETEWRGGIFDVQQGNVITNLSQGAIGYFAASTVVTDTTLVE